MDTISFSHWNSLLNGNDTEHSRDTIEKVRILALFGYVPFSFQKVLGNN